MNFHQMIRSIKFHVIIAVATFLLCFPYLLLLLSTLGLATLHGGGIGIVFMADVLLGATVAVVYGRSATFARVLPAVLMCLLAGLIVQAITATTR